MGARSLHWYNAAETSSWPLDDRAVPVSDGRRLPNNILVDCHLAWPRELGQYAFLSGLTVSAGLVTATFEAAEDLDGGTFNPLCAVSAIQPAVEGVHLAVVPQAPGVGGWIVLGSGVAEPWSGRFATPREGLLAPRAARPYRTLPVSGIGKLGAKGLLRGIVRLRAEAPLQLAAETTEIDGLARQAIVVRLFQNEAESYGFEAAGASTNLFQAFSGRCLGRPESGTCGDPQPVEFVNSVGPDCDGVIEIVLQGCAEVRPLADGHGAVVDCGLPVSEACRPPAIPDDEGRLPGEYDPSDIPVDPPEPPDPGDGEDSTPIPPPGELPFIECFDAGTAPDFVVKSGSFGFVGEDSPAEADHCGTAPAELEEVSYASADVSQDNVSVWEGFDTATLPREMTTDVKLTAGPSGARHNAAIVLNYRPHATVPGRFVFYLAELDYDAQELRIGRFNGTSYTTLAALAVPGLALDRWYRLRARTQSGPTSSQASITVWLDSLEGPALAASLGPLDVSSYYPQTGANGVCARRALSLFSFFRQALYEE